MSWVATAEECREMDRLAEAAGISVESLMHEAGRAVAAAVLEHFPLARRIAVVCGKGNNAGDGLVAARLLAEHQKTVLVRVAAPRSELNANASRELDRLREPGIVPVFSPDRDWQASLENLKEFDLIIDALLGTGSTGAPRGEIAEAITAIRESGRPVLAVDLPSGIDADTGAAPGVSVFADRTVTFGLRKPFLYQGVGLAAAGKFEVATIGFPESLLESPRTVRTFGFDEARSNMPIRHREAHKGSEGSVLIVAGNDRMPGAAALAARGALRGGAGLVRVASTAAVCEAISHQLPEAILAVLPSDGGVLTVQSMDLLAPELLRADAVVLGPGLSDEPETGEFLAAALREISAPCVLDADALNLMAKSGGVLPEACVLTPHPGEAGRLLGSDSEAVQSNRIAAARALAEKYARTVLLKGAHTLVAEPGMPLWVNTSGNAGMAAPGMGDVLSGAIGSLLAKGVSTNLAAALGAYWHGLAGDLARNDLGPAGYLASEVADALPRARATITST